MTVNNYAPLWDRLASMLAAALELESATIGAAQAELVADFLDYNEFGLAHEQLTDALSRAERTPHEETTKLLAEAADMMGIGDD